MRFIVALCMLVLLVRPAMPVGGVAQEETADAVINVELILDVSGSMGQVIDTGETRMDAAKRVIREVVAAIPEQDGINVGLRIYGFAGDNTDAGKDASCASSELVVPIDGVDKDQILQEVDALQPVGWTPLGGSLERAGADFAPGENVTNAVVLITDGLETCGGDPCSTAGDLHAAEINLITHVVGFALVPEEQATLGCIAENGGGMLLGAANADELSSALFDILEELEVVQGIGFIGGNALGSLPEGEPGELSVLAVGPYDGNVLPIVIRNNTGQDIIRVTAVATARNASGQIVGSGNDQLFSPNLVRAGGVAFGYAYFGGAELPGDTEYEIALDATPATDDEFENRRDLEIVETSTVDGRVVGTMQNIYDAELTGPFSVEAVCFDEAGTLLAHLRSYTNKESMEPGESVSFQVDNFAGVPCPLFLVAASGWDDSFGPDNSVEPPGTPLVTATETPDPEEPAGAASTPVTDAAGCVDLTSAESVLLALQAAGLPIGEYIVYDAANDPNELLGRPGQYIGKVNFVDTTIGEPTPDFILSEGGSIEVFATGQAAESRRDYIVSVTQSTPLLAEYDFLQGTVLLRLSKSFTPDEAAVYEATLIEIVSCPGNT